MGDLLSESLPGPGAPPKLPSSLTPPPGKKARWGKTFRAALYAFLAITAFLCGMIYVFVGDFPARLLHGDRTVEAAKDSANKAVPPTPPAPTPAVLAVGPSVVAVAALDSSGAVVVSGSGTVFSSDRVATSRHLAERGVSVSVGARGAFKPAKVLYMDVEGDVAVLSCEGLNVPPASVARAGEVPPGAEVFAAAPGMDNALFRGGYVSGLRRSPSGMVSLETSVEVEPGWSGSGLFDNAGRLVGVVSFVSAADNVSVAADNAAAGDNVSRRQPKLAFAAPAELLSATPSRAAAPSQTVSGPSASKSDQIREKVIALKEEFAKVKAEVSALDKRMDEIEREVSERKNVMAEFRKSGDFKRYDDLADKVNDAVAEHKKLMAEHKSKSDALADLAKKIDSLIDEYAALNPQQASAPQPRQK